MCEFHSQNQLRKSIISIWKRHNRLSTWSISHVTAILLLTCVISSSVYGGDSTYVGGDIFNDVWTVDQSPYCVIDIVQVINMLRIEPGVEVYFRGNFSIEIERNATLVAVGGELKGERILITSNSITWGGINFENASDFCSISNCDIYNVETAINCIQSDVHIGNNRIEARSVAINSIRSSPRILNNDSLIVIGKGNAGSNFKAISIRDQSNPQIIGNKWIECRADFGNAATGIHIINSQAVIRENWIEVISFDDPKGIDVDLANGVEITRNIIRLQSSPNARGLDFNGTTGVTVFNNDIRILDGSPVMGIVGIRITAGSYINIINNIIVGNDASTAIWASPNLVNDSCGYNLYYRHAFPYQGIGYLEGDIIEIDPLFISESPDNLMAYHIPWGSECHDQGYPAEEWNDPHDNSTSDIGRFWCLEDRPPDSTFINDQRTITPTEFQILASYPDPFNRSNTISFALPSNEYTQLVVFDVNGRPVKTLFSGNLSGGNHIINWRGEELSAGEYFIRLKAGSLIHSRKVTFLP